MKFVLDVEPVHEDDNMGSCREVTRYGTQPRSIDTVYADRAFASADVLDTLDQRPVRYVVPAPLSLVKRMT